jgi:benzoyl-CoA reductase/2-hydroxyglutaryl-CoA dehydratase subunit BcrC/BadD/HgdB
MTMPKIEHSELVRQLLTVLHTMPAHKGVRVFITGSDHDHPQFYQLVESLGAVIVGEDHDWGDRGYERLVDTTVPDSVDAIVDRYHFCPPAGAKFPVAERAAYTAARAVAARADVVICFIRHLDEGPRWDCPDQKKALAKHNIPYLLVDNQPYSLADEKPVADEIAAFLKSARK